MMLFTEGWRATAGPHPTKGWTWSIPGTWPQFNFPGTTGSTVTTGGNGSVPGGFQLDLSGLQNTQSQRITGGSVPPTFILGFRAAFALPVASGSSFSDPIYGAFSVLRYNSGALELFPHLGFANTAGQIAVYRGSATTAGPGLGTLLGTSTTSPGDPTPFDGNSHYYEIKATIDATVGTVEIRLDGAVILTLTGINTLGQTAGTEVHGFNWYSGGGFGSSVTLSDIVIMDTTGADCNSYLGDVHVETLIPIADGAHSDFAIGPANMLSLNQASMEVDASGWPAASNCTLARASTPYTPVDGSYYLQVTMSGAGGSTVGTATGTSGVPIQPNTAYTVFGRLRANLAARSYTASLSFYDNAGTLISTATGSISTEQNFPSTGWSTGFVTTTSPANAAYASIQVNYTSSAAGEIHFLDGFCLTPGTTPGYSRPAGPHYLQVQDHASGSGSASGITGGLDDDITFVSSSAVGAKDSYSHETLAAATGTVYAVNVYAWTRKTDTPLRGVKSLVISAGAEADGGESLVAQTWRPSVAPPANISTNIQTRDPHTSAAWTFATVNASEIGITVSS